MRRAAGIAAVLSCFAMATEAHAAGILYFSRDGFFDGLYTLDVDTGLATFVGISGVKSGTAGLAPSGDPGLLYGSEPFGFLHIQADGSGAVEVNPEPIIEGLAYDPTTGLAYGWFGVTGFDSYDPATGSKVADLAVPPAGADVEGLAYAEGFVYGLAGSLGGSGDLYRYDITLDSWSFVGATGVGFVETGLAYDPFRDVLYGIGSQDGDLYSIDISTAEARAIGPTGLAQTGGGLAFVSSVPEPSSVLLIGVALAILVRRRHRP